MNIKEIEIAFVKYKSLIKKFKSLLNEILTRLKSLFKDKKLYYYFIYEFN